MAHFFMQTPFNLEASSPIVLKTMGSTNIRHEDSRGVCVGPATFVPRRGSAFLSYFDLTVMEMFVCDIYNPTPITALDTVLDRL
jgi:hypothetical protein